MSDLEWPEGSQAPGSPRVSEGRGERRIVAFMGGTDRKGRWTLGRRCRVLNVMGGADLDLTQAALTADTVDLRITSIMGGSNVYVPEDINLEIIETAIMGGNAIRIKDLTPNPGGPTVRLRILSIMGGTNVKRGPKRTLRERIMRRRGTTSP